MRYKISLTSSDVKILKGIVKKGRHLARTVNRAKILLMADTNCKNNWNNFGGKTSVQICKTLGVTHSTPIEIKKRIKTLVGKKCGAFRSSMMNI